MLEERLDEHCMISTMTQISFEVCVVCTCFDLIKFMVTVEL
jgi:hypothetical protein